LISRQEGFSEDFRFRGHFRSSSGSIMDNTAEGIGRGGNREFVNFLSIAKGSNDEVRSQSYRSFDFDYITNEILEGLLERTDKISRKISNFIGYLKNAPYKGHKFN
jgi:four helix bundle protein